MSRTSRGPPATEGSWRMVDGDHDSFGTSHVPGISDDDDDDILLPLSSDPSSGFPSQPSRMSSSMRAAGSGGADSSSQDSIRDFAAHGEEDHVILREPFRPSLSSRAASLRSTPVPEFRMPMVDVGGHEDGPDGGSARVRRRPGKQSSPSAVRSWRQPQMQRQGSGFGVQSFISGLVRFFLWRLSIIAAFIQDMRRPLSIAIIAYTIVGAIIVAENTIRYDTLLALSPICRIPGTTLANVPFCSHSSAAAGDTDADHVDFGHLMRLQLGIGGVLEKSAAEAASLPQKLMESSFAVRELRNGIKDSDFDGRDELMPHFDAYIQDTNQLVDKLVHFDVAVRKGFDGVLGITRWTAHIADASARGGADDDDDASAADSGPLSWFTWLFGPFLPPSTLKHERVLRDRYLEHAALLTHHIDALLHEAAQVQHVLDDAHRHISAVHAIATRFSSDVTSRDLVLHWLGNLVKDYYYYHSASAYYMPHKAALVARLPRLARCETQRGAAADFIRDVTLALDGMRSEVFETRRRVAELPPSTGVSNAEDAALSLRVQAESIHEAIAELERAKSQADAATAQGLARHQATS